MSVAHCLHRALTRASVDGRNECGHDDGEEARAYAFTTLADWPKRCFFASSSFTVACVLISFARS